MWKPNTKYILKESASRPVDTTTFAFITDSYSESFLILKDGCGWKMGNERSDLDRFSFDCFEEWKDVKKKGHLPVWW